MDIRPALPNPFAPKVKKYQHNTIKYCAWEVLRDFPRGLSVGDIIREIMGKDLRKFYSKRKPESIVSLQYHFLTLYNYFYYRYPAN